LLVQTPRTTGERTHNRDDGTCRRNLHLPPSHFSHMRAARSASKPSLPMVSSSLVPGWRNDQATRSLRSGCPRACTGNSGGRRYATVAVRMRIAAVRPYMGLMPPASRPVRNRCMRTARVVGRCALAGWEGQGRSVYVWYCSSTAAISAWASASNKGPRGPARSGKVVERKEASG